MKFLADMGVSQTVVKTLRDNDYNALHLRDQGLQRLADLLAIGSLSLPSVIIFRLQRTKPFSDRAQERGLTPEILESILHE